MAKPSLPEITLVHYSTKCFRRDRTPLPHSLKYTAELDNDFLTETWSCRNCSTRIIRRTSMVSVIKEAKEKGKLDE